jgi:hypothetical protein
VEPGAILKVFQDPPNGNLAEVYNSKLGMAYVSAENRLSITDIYQCCGQDPIAMKETNPCGMGVDVGATLHVVVGFRPREKAYEVCYVARVSSLNDLNDIAKRFNVQFCVIDAEPETHRARDFQAAETFPVYLCDYIESIKAGPQWDEDKMLIRVNSTEVMDLTHELFLTPGALNLPRRSDEIDEFASQCRNTAKVLEENIETGSRAFRYRKLGEDHFRHALGYLWLAAQRIRVSDSRFDRFRTPLKAETDFDPLADGYGITKNLFD